MSDECHGGLPSGQARTRRTSLPWLWRLCMAAVLAAATACHAFEPRGPEPRPLSDPATLAAIQKVFKNTKAVRAIAMKEELKVYILDSPTLRSLVSGSFEKSFPPRKQHAVERFLRSLSVIPEDTNLKDMYLALLDEQVGGLYDPDTKRLYVREGYDIAGSSLARIILSHEMCHALQDHAFDLRKMGIEVPDNDDLALAASTVAEGDATIEMGEYAARFELSGVLKDMPKQALMSQSELDRAPYFFRHQLLFPYIQGQLFVAQAIAKGPEWRNRLFTFPPIASKQVLHPPVYFDGKFTVAPLALAVLPGGKKAPDIAAPLPPAPPQGYRRQEANRLGELGLRLILEERLGLGIATQAAEGWAGDAYAIYEDEQGHSWFCLETAWDTPRDTAEFLGAWVTLWRSIVSNAALGDLRAARQEFDAGAWHIRIESADKRLVCVWSN